MDDLQPYLARAAKARRNAAGQVLVATPEEARALARKVSAQIAGLSDGQKLLLFSDLGDLHEALKARLRHLDEEMEADRGRLDALGRNLRACGLYDAAKGTGKSRPARGR